MNIMDPKLQQLKAKTQASIKDDNTILDQRFVTVDRAFNAGIDAKKGTSAKEPRFANKSYTITTSEVEQVESVVLEFACKGMLINRSEVIRMGLAALISYGDSKFNMIDKIVRT